MQMMPVKYRFTEPMRTRVKLKDGRIVLMGYGIGDIVEVLEENNITLIPRQPPPTTPLSDGSVMLDRILDVKVERIWGP